MEEILKDILYDLKESLKESFNGTDYDGYELSENIKMDISKIESVLESFKPTKHNNK